MTRCQQQNRKKPEGGGRLAGRFVLAREKYREKTPRLAHLLESSAVISGHSRIVELSLLTWIMPSIIFRARKLSQEVDESGKHRRAKTPSLLPSDDGVSSDHAGDSNIERTNLWRTGKTLRIPIQSGLILDRSTRNTSSSRSPSPRFPSFVVKKIKGYLGVASSLCRSIKRGDWNFFLFFFYHRNRKEEGNFFISNRYDMSFSARWFIGNFSIL